MYGVVETYGLFHKYNAVTKRQVVDTYHRSSGKRGGTNQKSRARDRKQGRDEENVDFWTASATHESKLSWLFFVSFQVLDDLIL